MPDFNQIIYEGLESIGLWYSEYEGIVIDNNDPDKLGRIKVKCPKVWEDQECKIWIRSAHMFAGKKYGQYLVPEIGDNVWIKFQYGLAKFPVWSQGYYVKDNGISSWQQGQYIILMTPKGHLWIVDDKNGTIYMKFKDGKAIQLDKDHINLGNENGSQYSGTLGEKAKARMDEICNQLIAACQAIQGAATPLAALTVTCAAPGSPSTPPVNAAAIIASMDMSTVISDVQTIQQNLPEILSGVVKLD